MAEVRKDKLTPVQKLRIILVATAGAVILGSLGFMLLEGMSFVDALYMTFITLSTVGFGEVAPLDASSRIFTMFLIVFGVTLFVFAGSVIGQMILEGQLQETFGRKKMEGKIRRMSGHTIIAGFGRVGRQVAGIYAHRRAPFVVIDKEEDTLQRLLECGYLFVHGEATDDAVLRKAGIEEARTLVSTLPDEAQNVYLTLTARDIKKDLMIIARADIEGGEKKLARAGADHVVSPHVLGGQRMAMAALRPNVVDFMHTASMGEAGFSIEEIVLPQGSRLAGKSLVESNLKQEFGVHIIGIKKAGEKRMIVAPAPSTVLHESDVLVLVGDTDNLERLNHKMG